MGQLLGKVAGVVSGRRIVKKLSSSHQVLLAKSLSRSHQLLLFKSLSRSHQLLLIKSLSRSHKLLLVMRILLLVICLALLSDIHCRKGKKGKKTKSKGKAKPKPIKPSKAPPADITKEDCDALTQKLNDVAPVVTDLRTNMTEAQEEIKELTSELAKSRASNLAESRTGIKGQDIIALWDYQLGGYTTKCGPQKVTGWTETLDIHYAAGTAAGTDGVQSTIKLVTASSGTFTVPTGLAGYYNICVFFRFLKGGNAVDVTLKKNGAVVAAFGDAIEYDWRSTGTCTIQKLAAADTVTIHLESGGGSDCIEETGWYYGKFNGYLISVSA